MRKILIGHPGAMTQKIMIEALLALWKFSHEFEPPPVDPYKLPKMERKFTIPVINEQRIPLTRRERRKKKK
jgi:hypothetical protein